MTDLFGSYTWLVITVIVIVLTLLIRILEKRYWKYVTLPKNKIAFAKYFKLSYNDVFNDLSCVKTEWRNVFKMLEFSQQILDLNYKQKIRFKGFFTALRYSTLVKEAKNVSTLLQPHHDTLKKAQGVQDEPVIRIYEQYKTDFERFDDAFSKFMKHMSDIPKPVKIDTW
jgi:hypothetical protein